MKDMTLEEDLNDPVVQYMYELLDICTLGVCFEIHRSLRLGYWELQHVDEEEQKEYALVDVNGLDVFGQQPVKKQVDCVCPNCSRTLAANRFAPHLEKCMGMGRNSSRIASRRLQNSGQMEEYELENDIDYEWNSCEYGNRKSRKGRREKEKITNSPKRPKIKKENNSIGLSTLVSSGNGGSRPGTPCSTASSDTINSLKGQGPTLQALEALSQEEKVALLTQTCGAISEHTGKMCTRTGRCVQHSDEQRRSVRDLLLGDNEDAWPQSMRPEGSSLDQDDIHVDVDGYEDMEGGTLLRELTPLSWDQDSTGSDNTMNGTPVPPSPIVTKKKKGRKGRAR